jgi:stage III sporulation protein SpoIIIAA
MDDLLSPDKAEYATRETLVRSVQEHASAHGYAVAIKRSCNKDGVITLGCDRGDEYRSRHGVTETSRLRNTSSRYSQYIISLISNPPRPPTKLPFSATRQT